MAIYTGKLKFQDGSGDIITVEHLDVDPKSESISFTFRTTWHDANVCNGRIKCNGQCKWLVNGTATLNPNSEYFKSKLITPKDVNGSSCTEKAQIVFEYFVYRASGKGIFVQGHWNEGRLRELQFSGELHK